ncbi:MAG: YbdK family carboxylate-amine ligase [Desulfobulbaceae bacterium]|uniref:Putative glutamate--cysteine ligase 2 n=1 Tax=Candidatus Desulfatifera sulfidica TaxID=2841691 RepID=A0A8J6NAK8_9BACT|nr:YbdK family carboxylate-amine ligase [Candidatus Desulfatifera sulfidica]
MLLQFNPSTPLTIGIELEFQLLDLKTFNLKPSGPDLLKLVPMGLQNNIKAEFIQSMVEISSPVCLNMNDLEDSIRSLYDTLQTLLNQCECLPYAASLHPFAKISERQISPAGRYHTLMAELQLAGRRMMTQALHVHIGLTNREQLIQVCNDIRGSLPILLALSTSSPFLEGEDTGFHSYRSNIFIALPRTGIPEKMEGWNQFSHLIQILNEGTLLDGINELWWDVRPHPDFGTIEIRICDLPARLSHILGISALIQALVGTLIKRPLNTHPMDEIIRHNRWNASRFGLNGTCISDIHDNHTTFKTAALDLMERVRPMSATLNSEKYLDNCFHIINNGSCADHQRRLYESHGSFKTMIKTIQNEFLL